MNAPAKIRLLVVGIAGILAILALLFLRSRGWNSNAIACRGGETFEHFPVIETPVYLQRDKAWESDRIGGTGETLGRVGCTVCCLAMGLAHFGIQKTPGELNEWLKMHQGYSPRGWLRWETVSKLTAGKVYPALAGCVRSLSTSSRFSGFGLYGMLGIGLKQSPRRLSR